MSLEINLKGKRALVSGVSSGIGGGISQMLAQAGCDISGCGLEPTDSNGAQLFLESVRQAGGRAEYLSLDMTNPAEIKRWVDSAVRLLGGIDILVSNAGRNFFEGAENCSDSVWEECMDLNLASHWRLAQQAFPYLKKSGRGVIIVIASNHAFYTMPGSFPYNVAKAGLTAMVQSFAIEWGPAIRTVGIAPGFVETPSAHAWFQTFPDAAAKFTEIKGLHPVNKIGSVEEVGALCAFLSSDWGSFITGTTLLADGGRSALMQDGASYG